MGKRAEREKYLRNCAGTLQGQIGIDTSVFKGMKLVDIEATLRKDKFSVIYNRLTDTSPDEQLGRLACSGSEHEVKMLATKALIPAIALKVWSAANPKKVIKCRFCDWTTAKFARIGAKGFDRLREHLDTEHRDKAEEIARSIYGGMDERDEADVEMACIAEE